MVDLILDDWYYGGILFPHMMSRGKSEAEAGNFDNALEWYARAVMMDPESGAPWVQTGEIYYANEDWAEAEQALEIAEGRVITRDVSYKLGYSRFRMQEFALAADAFENAAARTAGEIGLSNVYFHLGLSVDSLPHDDEIIARAIDAYTEAIEIDEYTEQTWRQSDAYYRRGVLYLKLKRTEEAMAEFEQTLAINPTHYWAHVLMARVFWNAGDIDTALEYAEKAIEIRPDSKGAYRFLGEFYLDTGKTDQAREMYFVILSIDPNDEEALLVLESLSP